MESYWNTVKANLKGALPGHSFRMWIQPMEYLSSDDESITLTCPNVFSKKRVKDHYLQNMKDAFSELGLKNIGIELDIAKIPSKKTGKERPDINNPSAKKLPLTKVESDRLTAAARTSRVVRKGQPVKKTGGRGRSNGPQQLTLPGLNLMFDSGRILKRDFTFDKFVVGSNNDFAYSASLSMAQGSGGGAGAIYLLADTGLGKSHLSQAVGHHAMAQGVSDKVFYVTAEDFTNEMVHSLKNNTIDAFKEKYRRKCDVLILEDVHFLSGKEATQKELAMTLDYLLDAEKKLIFSGCYLPSDIPKMNDQLKSRLTMGVVTKMEAPDFKTRVKILKNKSKEKGCRLPEDVLHYIAQELCDNVRQLESGLNGVATKAALMGDSLDMRLAQSVLENIEKTRRAITLDGIKKLVCNEYGVTVDELVSPSRKKIHVHPRQIAIYLARKYTDQPLKQIGKSFNRYHATAIYSINAVEKGIKKQGAYTEQLNYLYKKIESGNI